MSAIQTDVDRFYTLLSHLEQLPSQGLRLRVLDGKDLPHRGVYFFREPGEMNPRVPGSLRIVRVGTHAVSSGSKATLYSRLKTHLGTRVGLGNHRGSIFRLHLGRAMLRKDNQIISTWGIGSTAPVELRSDSQAQLLEASWERKVSEYIGEMTVLWVDVPDEPSSTSLRGFIERNSIALLSNQRSPIIQASQGWLGHFSPREEIRSSSLWNLNHVDEVYDSQFLTLLDEAVERTSSSLNSSHR